MGGACSKSDDDVLGSLPDGSNSKYGTVGVMFDRFDKERKGYISLKNLKDMMEDDKTHFQGRDADHIMNKYGTDGKMNIEEFKQWWNSTYTTMVGIWDERILGYIRIGFRRMRRKSYSYTRLSFTPIYFVR